VTFKGRFHDLVEVNIVPAPVQWPIPIWFDGSFDAVVRALRVSATAGCRLCHRMTRLHALEKLRGHLEAFGRDPARFGVEGWLRMRESDPRRWAAAAEGWRRLGADMVLLYPMYRIPKLDDQIETLRGLRRLRAADRGTRGTHV